MGATEQHPAGSDTPTRSYMVELQRGRQLFTEYRSDPGAPGASRAVTVFTVRGDGPIADGRGLLWVEIDGLEGEVVTAATYPDHILARMRELTGQVQR